MINFQALKKGDRIMLIDGLAGGTTTGTLEQIHHEEEMLIYTGQAGNERYALFEEVIKKL